MAIARHPAQAPDPLAAALAHDLDAALQPFHTLAARSTTGALQRVSTTQLQALLVIERHGAVSIGTLAEAFGAIPSSITRLVQRLEAADLACRRADEADRRVVLVELTPSGAELVDRIRQDRQQSLAGALAQLPAPTQQRLVEDLTSLARVLHDSPVPSDERIAQGDGHPAQDPPARTSS